MITIAKCNNTVTDKSLCYFIVKNAPRVLLVHTKAKKNKHEDFKFVILLSSLHIISNRDCHLSMAHN